MDSSIACRTCLLPVPVDSAYSEGIDTVYCHGCMMRLKALRDNKVKVLEPGKCSISKCFGKSYFLMIKTLEFFEFKIEIPLQFCALHHHQIVSRRKANEDAPGIEFGRLVDYEEI